MMSDAQAPNGIQSAAILLMSLGENEAAEVLKHLGAREVQQLGLAMATIGPVSRNDASNVIERFADSVANGSSIGNGGNDFVRRVLVTALGEDRASGVIDRILAGRNERTLEALRWMDPSAIADLLREEHPQIAAIVLACLDQDQAAEVLSGLPERVRTDVVLRIATLDGISAQALAELEDLMARQPANRGRRPGSVGGAKVAAGILTRLESGMEQALLEQIRERDAGLGDKLNDLLFVFDNLGDIDDRGMQTVLRDVPGDKLGLALRGADPKVKDKVMRNMSKRAAEMLAEDMEARGPVRLVDVEAAQKEILAIVRRLVEAGSVQLGGKGGDFV
jgi:flagellar motor switch protein FliG